KTWKGAATIGATPGTVTVAVPALAPAEAIGVPAEGAAPVAGSRWGAQRIAGIAVGGAGIAGVIVGAVFGAQAIAKKNASNEGGQCDAKDLCDATGSGLRQDGLRAATISTIAMIAGGVAVAGGVVLVVTAPSKPR